MNVDALKCKQTDKFQCDGKRLEGFKVCGSIFQVGPENSNFQTNKKCDKTFKQNKITKANPRNIHHHHHHHQM